MRRLPALLLLSATLPLSGTAIGQTTANLEAQLSSYRYEEPELMQSEGTKLGIAGRITTESSGSFVRAEGRFAGGTVDYESANTGSDTGEPDYLFEVRILGGKSVPTGRTGWAMYAGLGYRYLLNDSSGHITTTGHTGYRRESNYLYLPLGLEAWNRLTDNRAVSFEIEYDHLLVGVQKSYIDDTISNQQRSGHGVRGAVDYHFARSWSIGIFGNHWRIGESERVSCGGGGFVCWEPKNRTSEIGLRVRRAL